MKIKCRCSKACRPSINDMVGRKLLWASHKGTLTVSPGTESLAAWTITGQCLISRLSNVVLLMFPSILTDLPSDEKASGFLAKEYTVKLLELR